MKPLQIGYHLAVGLAERLDGRIFGHQGRTVIPAEIRVREDGGLTFVVQPTQYTRLTPSKETVERIENGELASPDGNCVCRTCGYAYWQHPRLAGVFDWLRRLCDGTLVHL